MPKLYSFEIAITRREQTQPVLGVGSSTPQYHIGHSVSDTATSPDLEWDETEEMLKEAKEFFTRWTKIPKKKDKK